MCVCICSFIKQLYPEPDEPEVSEQSKEQKDTERTEKEVSQRTKQD